MIIPFPIALLVFSFVADLVYQWRGIDSKYADAAVRSFNRWFNRTDDCRLAGRGVGIQAWRRGYCATQTSDAGAGKPPAHGSMIYAE